MEMPVTVLRFAPARRRVRAVASVPLLFPLKHGRGVIRHVEKFAVGLVLWDIARLCMPPSSCLIACICAIHDLLQNSNASSVRI